MNTRFLTTARYEFSSSKHYYGWIDDEIELEYELTAEEAGRFSREEHFAFNYREGMIMPRFFLRSDVIDAGVRWMKANDPGGVLYDGDQVIYSGV